VLSGINISNEFFKDAAPLKNEKEGKNIKTHIGYST